MFRFGFAVLLCLATVAVGAAPRDEGERSADLRRTDATRAVQRSAGLAAEDVGDPDSFGRNAKYLGFAQSAIVYLRQDCTPDPLNPFTADERCVTLEPAPSRTSFRLDDLAVLRLPGRSTNSMLCHALTPLMNFELNNPTDAPQLASFGPRVLITIESEVLNNPTLIDPSTGSPYGGKIETSLSTYRESKTLQPGDYEAKNLTLTRNCIGGFINKRGLVEVYGLSEAQAAEFFRKPITVRLGAVGSASMVNSASYLYGFRVYGD